MSGDADDRDAPGLRVTEPKLLAPGVHPGMLRRGRLLELLDSGGASLTVLSAAVGYGKASLAELPDPGRLPAVAADVQRRPAAVHMLETVKSPARELYRKLGVSSRAEAVTSAEALGLLDRDQTPG